MEYTVVKIMIDQLRPHPRNDLYKTPLKEDSDEFGLIYASISAENIRQPLLVQRNTNIVISGHTRLRIARMIGLTEVPVTYLDIDDEAAETLLVSDNAERAGKETDLMRMARQIDRLYQKYSSRKEANKYVGGMFKLQERQLYRHRSLLKLISTLQNFVSQDRIGLKAGSAISEWSETEQENLVNYIFESGITQEKDWRITEDQAKKFIEKLRVNPATINQTTAAQGTKSFTLNESKPTSDEDPNLEILFDDQNTVNEREQIDAKKERAAYTAMTLLDRDTKAVNHMINHTLPAIDLAVTLGSSETKTKSTELKKTLKELIAKL